MTSKRTASRLVDFLFYTLGALYFIGAASILVVLITYLVSIF
ncbi:hypothetical protein [Bhargavaea cecembensis]|nr:hypothetical protein [Bhargavaea cecembensis]